MYIPLIVDKDRSFNESDVLELWMESGSNNWHLLIPFSEDNISYEDNGRINFKKIDDIDLPNGKYKGFIKITDKNESIVFSKKIEFTSVVK